MTKEERQIASLNFADFKELKDSFRLKKSVKDLKIEDLKLPKGIESFSKQEKPSLNQYFKELDNPERKGLPKNLALVFLNSYLGSGIFVNPNGAKIKKGELVGIYTGFQRLDSPQISGYEFDLFSRTYQKKKYEVVVDAKEMGNFTRFINHSFFSNCQPELRLLPDQSLEVCIFATKDIRPGEQLLFNYGYSYWSGRNIFYPFELRSDSFLLDANDRLIQKPLQKTLDKSKFTYVDKSQKESIYKLCKSLKAKNAAKDPSIHKKLLHFISNKDKLELVDVSTLNKAVVFVKKGASIRKGDFVAIRTGKWKVTEKENEFAYLLKKSKEKKLVLDSEGKSICDYFIPSKIANVKPILVNIKSLKKELKLENESDFQVVYQATKNISATKAILIFHNSSISEKYPDLPKIDWSRYKKQKI